MGLWDKLKNELVDIVEWLDSTKDTMVWRFPRYQNEIKYGAQLVVRESQAAVFVNMGKIADVYMPGMYTLDTKNMPILATLMGWKYGFNSPFKCEVYFVSTRQFTDLKWGTMNPIMLRDPEFGPMRLRAFGTYAMRAKDPAAFVRQIAGTNAAFTTDDVTSQLRNIIVSRFTDILGESKIPALDLASNYNEVGDLIHKKISPEFEAYGIELTKLLIENISLPPEVEKILDQRTSMGIVGNMQQYTAFQVASSIPDAAKNPGGLAAAGAGIGLGVAMAGPVAQALNPANANAGAAPNVAAAAATPPPLPGAIAVAFFAAVNGQQTGPFDMATLQQQAGAGKFTRDTLVWRQGMAAWTAAGSVPELVTVFANVPPPLPK